MDKSCSKPADMAVTSKNQVPFMPEGGREVDRYKLREKI